MFPWSVMPIAGISSRWASASIGEIFAAPSSIEYSVWLCRCTKDEEFIGSPVYGRPPTSTGVSRCVSSQPSALSGKPPRTGLHGQGQAIDQVAHCAVRARQHEQFQ